MEETSVSPIPGGRGRPPLHKRNAKGLIRKMRPFYRGEPELRR
jgi:hypothetical protein